MGSNARREFLMPIPKAFRPQTLNALSGPHYETSRQIIDAHNQLLTALGPGSDISPASFAITPQMGVGASIAATSGSIKRGQFTLTIGTAPSANPSFTLNIPKGEFGGAVPFVVLTQSGGTGTLTFSYSTSVSAVTISINGTPSAGATFTFSFQMTD
jgi:hypothetical protein